MRSPSMPAALQSEVQSFLSSNAMTAGPVAREDEFRTRPLAFADIGEQLQRRCGERDLMVLFLLGRGWWLRPSAVLNIVPAHGEHFAAPSAGHQQQPDRIGRLLVGMLGQR